MGIVELVRRGVRWALLRAARFVAHDLAIARAMVRRWAGRETAVVESLAGERAAAGEAWAIFVIWQAGELPWYVRTALEALARADVNVLAVLNRRLSARGMEELRGLVAHVLVRENSGFDFGAYRDGTLFLGGKAAGRVIYLNDSVYYLERGLDALVSRLRDSGADVCGAFENWEYHYHVQSFCFSVSPEMFGSEKFQRFWRRYLPVSSRAWAVAKGEMKLSAAMLPTAREVEIVFSPASLESELPCDARTLRETAGWLSRDVRPGPHELDELGAVELRGEVLRRVGVRAQMHTGAFLFIRYLGCPLLKRDLVYRLKFDAYEVEGVMRMLPAGVPVEQINADFRRKGAGTSLRGWKRLLYDQWII